MSPRRPAETVWEKIARATIEACERVPGSLEAFATGILEVEQMIRERRQLAEAELEGKRGDD